MLKGIDGFEFDFENSLEFFDKKLIKKDNLYEDFKNYEIQEEEGISFKEFCKIFKKKFSFKIVD